MSLLTHMERWKDIECYEGLYQISSCGRVKRLGCETKYCPKKNHILKPKINKKRSNYHYVNLSKDNKIKTFKIHRLVAQAFIPNPLNLPQVNHKDENVFNNYAKNLEWCDAKYNVNYGSHKEKQQKAQKCKKVICIETNVVYPSISECSRVNKIDLKSISWCCKGKYKTAGGYHWKYVD